MPADDRRCLSFYNLPIRSALQWARKQLGPVRLISHQHSPGRHGEMSSRSNPINTGLSWTGWNKCFHACQDTLRSSVIYLPHCHRIVRTSNWLLLSGYTCRLVCLWVCPPQGKNVTQSLGGAPLGPLVPPSAKVWRWWVEGFSVSGLDYWTVLLVTAQGPLDQNLCSCWTVDQISTERCKTAIKRHEVTTQRYKSTTKWCDIT